MIDEPKGLSDWSNPSPEMRAALALVMARKPSVCRPRRWNPDIESEPPIPLPETHAAEMLVWLNEHLIGHCIRDWSEKAPDCYELKGQDDAATEKNHALFRLGCSTLKEITDSGYNATTGRFWDLAALWPDRQTAVAKMVTLAMFGYMLHTMRYPTSAMDLLLNDKPILIPASFDMVLEIILGVDYLDRFKWSVQGKRQPKPRGGRRRKAAS